MNTPIIRLLSLSLDCFKNVEHGDFEMPHAKEKIFFEPRAELLGIYGQNGSGKTAVIDAMRCIQILIQGGALTKECGHLIMLGRKEAWIRCQFSFQYQEQYRILNYGVCLSHEDSGCCLVEESLDYAPCSWSEGELKRERIRGIATFTVRSKPTDALFSPAAAFSELVVNRKELRQALLVAKAMSYDSTKSYIFGKEAFDIFSTELVEEKRLIVEGLKTFATRNMTVIGCSRSGVISLNLLPVSFVEHLGRGSFPVTLTSPNTIPLSLYENVKRLLVHLNMVLRTVVPGLTVASEELGEELMEDAGKAMRFELVSVRDGNKIPLRYESEGIKKLISILGVLTDMYNKPHVCLLIDELDAGIFEYLLGELLKVIEENGKGQLIFTSHNLRPLEMLEKDSIVFSTTNPLNRYIRFTGIKNNHNLRDRYIRAINLSGQSEDIYNLTEASSISRAFRKAGKGLS